MKNKYKILIGLLTTFLVMLSFNVRAIGYTYDHRGQPINSTAGFTVNQTPKLAKDLQIDPSVFVAPEDMYIYTTDTKQKLIYIVDSNSNRLFVLNDSLQLVEEVKTFTLKANKFNDDQLRAIKSSQQFIIAENVLFSVPKNLSDVNLVHTENSSSKVLLQYTVDSTVGEDYEIKWVSGSESIARVAIDEATQKQYIVSYGVGNTTITGNLYVTKESDDELTEPVKTLLATVKIVVRVTETAQPNNDQPHYGFSIDDLRKTGSIQLHLSGVTGVFRAVDTVTKRDFIYLADRTNNQIVVVDSLTYEVEKVITTPDDVTFKSKQFLPRKLIADTKGRMYVIADNVYEGIMQFSPEGKFDRFTGINYVSLTPWEIFWRNFSTEAQLAKQSTIINTSFTSLTVDNRGFIYTTSYALTNEKGLVTDNTAMIKKINQSGKDILRRNGYQPPMGDGTYLQGGTLTQITGPSKFVAVDVNEDGLYTLVDAKMGKLFTYDNEGRLLYISGNSMYNSVDRPTQTNVLSNPVAIRYLGNNLIVLDKNNKSIITYEPTDIGSVINEAASLEFHGYSAEASDKWEEVVKLNANYEYAYIGIGKNYLKEENYEKAMEYFEKGANRELYSRAYKLKRDAQIRKYFAPVMGIALILVAGRVAYKAVFRKKFRKEVDSGMGDE